MNYYSEEKRKQLRETLEHEILHWPQVSSRLMFGCPAYLAKGRLFAFLVNDGVVVTQLSKRQRASATQLFETMPFRIGQREISRWLQLSVPDGEVSPTNLKRLLRFIRYSYETAMEA